VIDREKARPRVSLACSMVLAFGASAPAAAEPYLAVAAGLKCVSCHTNPTGGGKRNVFGTTYARTELAAQIVRPNDDGGGWTGELGSRFAVGGDYRGGYRNVDVPGPNDTSSVTTRRVTVYAEIRALPELLTLYVDEQLAPDDTVEREHYALVTPANGKVTIKAGQFFLPFGLRLEDDGTFVRQRSGINFTTPDDGVEVGLELPRWSAQAAATNGTAGRGSEPGKDQWSFSAVHVRPRWRIGASYNVSDDPLGDREMHALFAGFTTGPVAWLAELDFITDKVPAGGANDLYATLIEGNWRLRKGYNLKAAFEFLDPSDGAADDEQERYSVVLEYSPMQLVQARGGLRVYNGVPQQPLTNRNEVFAELHVYF
jgi:hypothetical protein